MAPAPAHVVLRAARRAARATDAPMLLAVSGGLDSMALLHAMAQVARPRIAAVATLDHGTGIAATAAAAHVARTAGALGLPVVMGRLPAAERAPDGWEAEWRRARHAFLRRAAADTGARIVMAHTRDDQVETVLMRIMRGAGARGLAGMGASSDVVRPWLGLPRAPLAAWMRGEGAEWVEDPGNESLAHLRNRVRREILPALRRVAPTIDADLLRIAAEAAAWRAEVDTLAEAVLSPAWHSDGTVSVASQELAGYDPDSLAMLWGSLASRAGLALDWRGTHRVASFIMKQPVRGSIPLSGGWCVEARRGRYLLGQPPRSAAAPATLPRAGVLDWGRFRFRADGVSGPGEPGSWHAAFTPDVELRVRGWTAGDRLLPAGGQPRRRVARYLTEAGVRGGERAGWPVVVAPGRGGEEVVWIPGVRRSDAATERSGGPVRYLVCERIAP